MVEQLRARRGQVRYTPATGYAGSDSFTYTVSDGFGGTSTATLTETNAILATSGQLTASDVDSPATFQAASGVAGSNGYGTFSINASGAWTYAMSNAHDEFVNWTDYTDSVTVATADGTTRTVTVTIHGSNDAAVIGGTSTGSVGEDGTGTATGALTITDGDAGQAGFAAGTLQVGQGGTLGDAGIASGALLSFNRADSFTHGANTTGLGSVSVLGGGNMIADVRFDGFTTAELPAKFEAGTPPITEAVGLGAAVGHFLLILSYQRVPASQLMPYMYGQIGFAMLGALTFLPTFMQFVDGVSATESGLRTLPMVGSSRKLRQRRNVVLPLPVGPVTSTMP